MEYTIDKDGMVMIGTTLPEWCAECDAAEWKIDAGELTCESVRKCARLFARLAERQTRRSTQAEPIAKTEDEPPKVEERREGREVPVTFDRGQTRDRLAVDEAQAERSAAEVHGIDRENPVEWWRLPHHMTAKEFAACCGVSRSSISGSFPGDLLERFGAWARLPNDGSKHGTKVGLMIDEAALDEWKERPRGKGASKTAAAAYDEAITWRWVRGFGPLQIARELGLSRAFVRRRVREIFGA